MRPSVIGFDRLEVAAERMRCQGPAAGPVIGSLRHALAWCLATEPLGSIAAKARVPASLVADFLCAAEADAGDLLTLAQAARLADVAELELLDRHLPGEYQDANTIAEHYCNVYRVHPGDAVRLGEETQRRIEAGESIADICAWGEAATRSVAAPTRTTEVRIVG